MIEREAIVPTGMEPVYEQMHYAPAVRVDRTIYVSGQIGRDEQMQIVEGREAQMVQAFENLRRVLAAAGAGMADIVDLTSYHTDTRDLKLFMKVKDRYLARDYPAWTTVGVASLGAIPGLIVEIKAVAVTGTARA